MTITDINNPVNAESIAAFLAAEHKRHALPWNAHVNVSYPMSPSGTASFGCYGHAGDRLGFIQEWADTLDEAITKYKAATNPAAHAARLRAEAAELVKQAAKVEGLQ
jgi:hypothetical protein